MIVDYQARKNEVLALADAVEVLIKDIKKSTTLSNGNEFIDLTGNVSTLLEDMRSKAERVKADRFTIIIAGESKSGKSTFINAYLGVELLPMDIKQCTSSIIEVKYGDKFSVKATYADGHQEEIVGEDAAREFLKKNAALDDAYRDIPVPTINSEILVKSGLRSRAKGRAICIAQHEVEELLKSEEIQDANIYRLPDYNERIKNYINVRKNQWEFIVTKIEVFFPFEDESLKGIEIIDSPGVCAHGGVSEITSEYIENADAIIFLKPISGQALESIHFNQFMKNSSVAKNKNALFLVLTRATSVTDSELRRLEEEAYKQFNMLDTSNILIVDSKAELYVKYLECVENIEEELRRLNAQGDLDDFVTTAYTETNGIFASKNTLSFIDVLRGKSRFNGVYNGLNTLGRKAHYLSLHSLLETIEAIYTKLLADFNSNISFLETKVEDPIALSHKIGETKKELEDIQNKMSRGVNQEAQYFIGSNGIIPCTAEKVENDFEQTVNTINADSKDAFNQLEKASFKTVEEFKNLTKTLQEEVINRFDKTLITLTDKQIISFEVLKPDFTEDTFKELLKSTKSKARKVESYESGVTFKETHTYSTYSQNKHFRSVKKNILNRLQTIKDDMMNILLDFVTLIQKRYIDELAKNAYKKKGELDKIVELKATSEELIEMIKRLSEFIKKLDMANRQVRNVKGGISKYVQ
ncbi:MAG: dynamin family protein [Veillonella caviae]|uniref:dynamin family protein n=1 Tax=Veillonella caviae TaxID=248316 RepID=UPI002A91114F|nr:dynamin family protein [Veillonella caviae]MDY5714853.1 dynamin family protein [Veillonella caviae]